MDANGFKWRLLPDFARCCDEASQPVSVCLRCETSSLTTLWCSLRSGDHSQHALELKIGMHAVTQPGLTRWMTNLDPR
nr:hypothetical protein CFP56_02865 [Quercus suber]